MLGTEEAFNIHFLELEFGIGVMDWKALDEYGQSSKQESLYYHFRTTQVQQRSLYCILQTTKHIFDRSKTYIV